MSARRDRLSVHPRAVDSAHPFCLQIQLILVKCNSGDETHLLGYPENRPWADSFYPKALIDLW